jgi:NitT/TauT family transport system permease protein
MNDINISNERRAYLKDKRRRKRLVFAFQIGILLLFIAIWELAAQLGWIDSFILSQPSRIGATLSSLVRQDLLNHVFVTVYETLTGFILGVLTGTILAVILWWSSFISKVCEP